MGSTVRWAALGLVLLGCGKKPPTPPTPEPAVSEPQVPAPFQFPSTLEYVEHTRPGPMPEVADRIREVAEAAPDVPPPDGHAGAVVQVSRTHPDQDPDGEKVLRSRYLVGPEGIAHFAAERPGGWNTYAPKVELPVGVKQGDTWTGLHGEGDALNERSCVVDPTPFCDDGWAVTCTIHWPTRATWMRHHWCPADGWRGFEVVLNAGPLPVWIWSTDVVRDGRALPDVPMEQRPMPEAPPEVRPPASP